jgi:hypothetical protein
MNRLIRRPRKAMKRIALLLALFAGLSAFGQEAETGVPADVYYLLPEFQPGMVYFFDRSPAQGKLNICAEDQTLRFIDEKGVELTLDSDDVTRVVIDNNIIFVRIDDAYYRLYPITDGLTLALRRKVVILRDARKGAYGIESRIAAIREVGMIQSDGTMHTLETTVRYPYDVTETWFLYEAGGITPITKRSLRKRFPNRREDLDTWLKSHHFPKDLEGTRSLLHRLALGENLE